MGPCQTPNIATEYLRDVVTPGGDIDGEGDPDEEMKDPDDDDEMEDRPDKEEDDQGKNDGLDATDVFDWAGSYTCSRKTAENERGLKEATTLVNKAITDIEDILSQKDTFLYDKKRERVLIGSAQFLGTDWSNKTGQLYNYGRHTQEEFKGSISHSLFFFSTSH